jgi:hypothetical protein
VSFRICFSRPSQARDRSCPEDSSRSLCVNALVSRGGSSQHSEHRHRCCASESHPALTTRGLWSTCRPTCRRSRPRRGVRRQAKTATRSRANRFHEPGQRWCQALAVSREPDTTSSITTGDQPATPTAALDGLDGDEVGPFGPVPVPLRASVDAAMCTPKLERLPPDPQHSLYV